MSDDLKALVRRLVDEYESAGNVAVADELLADDFVDHSPMPGTAPDKEGVKALFSALREAIPDLHAEVHDMLVDGDKVVTRKTLHGTHKGPFLGLPPTGDAIAVQLIDIVRIRDGQLVEHWNVVDSLALMQQIGAIPT